MEAIFVRFSIEGRGSRRFWWTTNRSKIDPRSVLMKLAGDGRGIRRCAERKTRMRDGFARKSRPSRIPDIGINSTIKHSAGRVHKVIAIAPRALQRADLWTGVACERKSNPLGTRSTENRLHMCCSRHASPRNECTVYAQGVYLVLDYTYRL